MSTAFHSVDYGLIGHSEVMDGVRHFIALAAPTDSTVLITGPSGTGKERVARLLHTGSPRRDGPFIAVNCAALPEALFESELFGHEKGAFTGAAARQRGKFELADRGTLFLDEVGELPSPIQPKLLRALEERVIDRIGAPAPIRVDIRLVAATNRDLRLAAADGSFREDLYYRLKVLTVRMPALAERREDIRELAEHFLAACLGRCTRGPTRSVRGFAREAIATLEAHDWPGNARELRNAIEHAVVLGSGDLIGVTDLPDDVVPEAADPAPGASRGLSGTYYEALYETRRQLVETALTRARGDYRAAAEILGLHPKSMHRMIESLGLGHLLKREPL